MVKIMEIEGPALLWYTARLNDDATSCAYSPSATLGKTTHKVRIQSSLLA
jgi:hypothetical protein